MYIFTLLWLFSINGVTSEWMVFNGNSYSKWMIWVVPSMFKFQSPFWLYQNLYICIYIYYSWKFHIKIQGCHVIQCRVPCRLQSWGVFPRPRWTWWLSMPWSMPASLHGPWRWNSLPNWVTWDLGKGQVPHEKGGILTCWKWTYVVILRQFTQKYEFWPENLVCNKHNKPKSRDLTWFCWRMRRGFRKHWDYCIYCHEKWRFDIRNRDSTSKTQGLYRQTIGIQPWKDWDFYHPEIGIQPWKHNPKIEIRPWEHWEFRKKKLELNMIQPTSAFLRSLERLRVQAVQDQPKVCLQYFHTFSYIFACSSFLEPALQNMWHHKKLHCWFERMVHVECPEKYRGDRLGTWVPFANLGMVNCFCFLLGLSLWF